MRVGCGGEHGSSNHRIPLITDPRILGGGAIGNDGSAERLQDCLSGRRQRPSCRFPARLPSISRAERRSRRRAPDISVQLRTGDLGIL